jgi:MFS family permease
MRAIEIVEVGPRDGLQNEQVSFTTVQNAALYRKLTWRLAPLLVLCYALGYLDRINIGYAKLQMQADLGFSDTAYGVGASVFFISYFLFSIPSNLLLTRIGARRTILILVCGWGLVSASLMLVTTSGEFYSARFLLGMFEAGIFPGMVLYLTYWYPTRWHARTIALLLAGGSVAGILGGPISGGIMQLMDGVHGWRGWQWMFLFEGFPSILLGMLTFAFLDDRPSDATWLTGDEKVIIAANLSDNTQERKARNEQGIGETLRNPHVYLLSLTIFLLLCGGYVMSFWLPTLIRNSGVKDVFVVGLYSSVPFTGGAIAMIIVGNHSDRTGERRWHFSICALCAAVGLVVASLHWPHPVIPVLMMTITNMGIGSALTVFWTIPPSVLSKSAAPAGIAFINGFSVLAGVFSPAAFGFIANITGQFAYGLYMTAALLALSALSMLTGVSLPMRAKPQPDGSYSAPG